MMRNFPDLDEGVLARLNDLATKNSLIASDLYNKYDVKRGLRDIDGRGVLIGLTEIGEVHSYVLDENEIVPVPGRLLYRGYDINDIVAGFLAAGRFGFEETCYLLLFGELPDRNQLEDFTGLLTSVQKLPEYFVRDVIQRTPSKDIMNLVASAVLALYSFDKDPDNTSVKNVLKQCLRLIAWFPSLAVYAYQTFTHYFDNNSLFLHSPQPELSIAENILHMLRPDNGFTELEAKVLDLALVLHAEHGGGNNSSFVTHVVTSTGTDTYAVISAALGALKGPRHGGANHKVVQMIEEMKREIDNWKDEEQIRAYLLRLLNNQAFDKQGKIYGIGHAVYSISDPRAIILKEQAAKLAVEKGLQDEFDFYARVERLAPQVIAEVRKMYKGVSANVDFYSGFVYRMLNIPQELFTPLFAVARIVGWSAHRIEEIVNEGKIIRPAYKSIAPRRQYVSMDCR